MGRDSMGNWGEIAPDIGRKAANHTAMCVPVQQSCMFFTCTPKPKMQFKKKEKEKSHTHKKEETEWKQLSRIPVGRTFYRKLVE